MAIFGKGGKRGAPVGNKNAAGKHRTGGTDGRIMGTAMGALHPVAALTHGMVRGSKGAKSRAGSAALGGAATLGGVSYLMGKATGDEDFAKGVGMGGALVGAGLSSGFHKVGHRMGTSSYNNKNKKK